jgi:hypothetical protein
MGDASGDVMAVNWKLREGRLTAELWEAVFLSQDIEPVTPSGYGYPESLLLRTRKRATDSQAEEFDRRVHIAYDHLITGRLATVARNEAVHESRVELTVFRQWAESLEKPWTFPEQFPRAAPIEAQRETGAKQTPSPSESTVHRRKRRYEMCLRAGLEMPDNDYAALPRGIGKLAEQEGISRQAFSEDVKAHIRTPVDK